MTDRADKKSAVRNYIRDAYGKAAGGKGGCGCGAASGADDIARLIGYSDEQLQSVPAQANLGLGCGNPTAVAELKEGETVLDLGSGAGMDCFLAGDKVGPGGRVIGVDMTPEMVEKARANTVNGAGNVEFRLGEIEHLPLADASVDVIISNCVINLSVDKRRVVDEMIRVLKPGGRLAVSDIALLRPLPESIKDDIAAYSSCISGALQLEDYQNTLLAAGFERIEIERHQLVPCGEGGTADPLGKSLPASLPEGQSVLDYAASVYVRAVKPDGR